MTRILHPDFRHPTIRVCDRARDLFFKRFGLDWDRFKAEGMDADELRGPEHEVISLGPGSADVGK